MRVESGEWRECSTGGGEETANWRVTGGSPALLHPAASRAEEGGVYPGRRSPEGDGGVMGGGSKGGITGESKGRTSHPVKVFTPG